MYTITLSDGTKLKNLELNGNNYISNTILEDSVFEGKLDTVVISDGEKSETFTDMKLMSNRVDGGKSWFVLGEKTAQEKKEEAIATVLAANVGSITDLQLALAEVYEMILGGM